MGAKILSTTLYSVFMVGIIDIFLEWYRGFLTKRGVNVHFIQLLRRLTFVILAFLFWRSMVPQINSTEFASTHFYFALFIYCFYRLISSFFKGRGESR